MKPKNLMKKIRRLEKRLQEGSRKLAKLKQNLQAAESAKAMKAARKSARATAAKSSPSTGATKPSSAKKAKKKLNLSPERRAQLAAAMKARWAAKRAVVEALPEIVSTDQASMLERTPQAAESRHEGA